MRRSASKTAAVGFLIGFALLISGCGSVPPGTSAPPPQTSSSQAGPGASSSPSGDGSPTGAPSSRPPSSAPPSSQPPEQAAVDCKKLKCVALTYDDGPSPETTPQLLKILKKYKARATFFQLGSLASQYPELEKQIHELGSEVANHSWNHETLSRLSSDGAERNLTRATKAIEKGCGCKITLMRPPGGSTDKSLDKTTKRLGLAEIMWDVDTRDWETLNTSSTRRSALNAHRNQVVLMHDIHQPTIDAQDDVISGLQDKGYTLVTVSELLGKQAAPGTRYPKSWGSY
ncbi:polysaccharide deacetylase family protein [Microlunatus speluncae]|uniref:polysaccharide deacetylase family protein n=1 Tax=Microlunatus speluncae TaxID=2594267 RepID=UPI001FE2E00F|nr:polysaccharide deacetylase family protein [Microlunatus speluncae]